MRFRTLVFWLHLATGVVVGAVVLLMSATGVLLAYERAIVAAAERAVTTLDAVPASATRLRLDGLADRAAAVDPATPLAGLVIHADPRRAVSFSFGPDRTVALDPYSGDVRGEGANRLRRFFHVVTDLHRWLGAHGPPRETARAVTGAANLAFLGLVVTGVVLWWPRRWSRRALRAVSLPSLSARGWRRDWNWHNALGLWAAPLLLVVIATGVLISYPWAADLLARVAGGEPSSRPGGGPGGTRGGAPLSPPVRPARLEAALAAVAERAPHWRTVTMRFPPAGAPETSLFVEEATSAHPYPRSVLTVDVATSAVRRWEPFDGADRGRRLRSWVRPLHTGEAAGFVGQTLAALASAAACVLVWTGIALSWRRLRRHAGDPAAAAPLVPRGATLAGGGTGSDPEFLGSTDPV